MARPFIGGAVADEMTSPMREYVITYRSIRYDGSMTCLRQEYRHRY